MQTVEEKIADNRRKFIKLIESGVSHPEYLAREVFPELYDAIPALAIVEAKEYLEKYRRGELTIGEEIMAKKKSPAKVEPKKPDPKPDPKPDKPARPARQKKPKQQTLPGVETDSIPEIEEAAEEYTRVRDERMELTEEETAAQAKLLDLMRDHNLDKYKYDGKIVAVLQGEAKVKVKKAKDPTAG